MLRKGPANVAGGDYVAEFKARKGKHWTPMNDPTSSDACRRRIERRRLVAPNPNTEYRIRNLKTGDVEEV